MILTKSHVEEPALGWFGEPSGKAMHGKEASMRKNESKPDNRTRRQALLVRYLCFAAARLESGGARESMPHGMDWISAVDRRKKPTIE